MSTRTRVRVVLASAPWQLVMLAAALSEYQWQHQHDTTTTRTILLLNDPRGSEKLREALGVMADCFSMWDKILWDEGLLTLKFPKDEWPIRLEKYADPIKEKLGLDRVDELWVCHLFHIEHHAIVETFPEARIFLYEDGLGDALPWEVRGWRDHLRTVWLAPRLLLRGKLATYMRSVRLCDWRPSWFHLRRVVHRYVYLARHFPPPAPFQRTPFTAIHDDTMKKIIAVTSGSPIVLETSVSPDTISRRDVLFLGQDFHEVGALSWEDEAKTYLDVIKGLLSKGYRVWWKEHPREATRFFSYLAAGLPGEKFFEVRSMWPAESLIRVMPFEVCVSTATSSLFYLADLFGVRTYTCAEAMRSVMKASFQRDSLDLTSTVIPSVSTIPRAP